MPDASLDRLQQCLTEVSYPKGFRVLKCGKVEKDIFFIKQGIVRAYTSVDGKEITFFPLSAKCKWAFFISNNSCLQGVDKNIKERKNLGMKPVVANVSGVGADFFFLGDFCHMVVRQS